MTLVLARLIEDEPSCVVLKITAQFTSNANGEVTVNKDKITIHVPKK